MKPYAQGMLKAASVLGMSPGSFNHVADLAGLALLAGVPVRHIYKSMTSGEPIDKTDTALDLAGLGVLATPTIIRLAKGTAGTH